MAENLSAKVAWKLRNALKQTRESMPTKVGPARVTRRDPDGSMWVRLPGSSVDTPVNGQVLSDAAVGDTVSVRIENGRLSLTGNASTPSVGQQQVSTIVRPVQQRADDALETASTAQTAAELATSYAASAQRAADDAQQAADDAQGSADEAAGAAKLADDKAQAASDSALRANVAAEGAILGLSTVEDVVKVLDWVGAHGAVTSDAVVMDNKAYYFRDPETGVIRRIPDDPSQYSPADLNWLEASATEDTEAVEGKAYYVADQETGALSPVTEVPTGADPSALGWLEVSATEDTKVSDEKVYYYANQTTGNPTPVPDPLDPSALGWVELDEAVTEYLASHLAQTDSGLNIKVDGHEGHIHLGTLDGEHEYGTYIVGEDNIPEANFGVHTRIGREDGMHVDITSDISEDLEHGIHKHKLFSIANADLPSVMYVEYDDETDESTVYMTHAVVVSNLRFGNWMWYERPNGNMSVKWVGDPEPSQEAGVETEGGE